jgi:hypothetical protein
MHGEDSLGESFRLPSSSMLRVGLKPSEILGPKKNLSGALPKHPVNHEHDQGAADG